MKLLFIGGTQFVGRHAVAAALARGHQVTLFNRGRTNAELFPQAEKLHGDRNGDLHALAGRAWDAVIDVNGYVPRQVRDLAAALRGRVGHYVFVSTISVYDDAGIVPGMDEDAPLAGLADATTEEVTNETYGGLKVLCEQAAAEAFAGRAVNVRPGIVAGPHDPTDRVTYWLQRLAQGGTVAAPGDAQRPVQFIDARDLGDFIVLAAERALTGSYNAVSPWLTWEAFAAHVLAQAGAEGALVYIDDFDFVRDQLAERRPYGALPLAVPAAQAGIFQVSSARAQADGLTFTPLAQTVGDTLAWAATRAADYSWRAGLTAAQEAQLLAAWRARGAGLA